jgi:hypothetical protein
VDDASDITFDAGGEVATALRGAPNSIAPVVLEYTALAHPEQWSGAPHSPEAAQYRSFVDSYQRAGLRPPHPADLQDGEAIMTHDAVLAAVKAIRDTLPQGSEIPLPSPEDVVQNLAGLRQANSVPGASGKIDIDTTTGNPSQKAIPSLRLQPDQTVSFKSLERP